MGGACVESRPANYLRAWREHRGLTQAQLAAMAGTEGSVISLLESGDRGLSDKWLRRLALPLKTTPGALLDFHPESVNEDMLEQWGRIRDTQTPRLRATVGGAPTGDRSENASEDARDKLVELGAHSPKQDMDSRSKRGRKKH
jgi:transcriptional regulator with XRE-family HTH domain